MSFILQTLEKLIDRHIRDGVLVSNPLPVRLKVLLLALTDRVFSVAFKFTDYTRNRSPLYPPEKKS
jgi:hypothetical protein